MPPPTPLRTTVLLRHEPGSPEDAHYDWMVAISPGEPLASWRTAERLDEIDVGRRVQVQRIQDHDLKWLALDEPTLLSNGRGVVRPCSWGQVLDLSTGKTWLLQVQWANGALASYRVTRPDSPEGTLTRL